MKKIGVLGGTFNPPHLGHISLAKKALQEFGLDLIIFIPTGTPPHKTKEYIAPKNHRYNMTKLAVKENKKFKISKIEINKKGYSYAVDTFKKLIKNYGKNAELFYIVGMDSINTIFDWKKPLELFKFCKFIIAGRPGQTFKTFKRIMKFPPISQNKDKITIMPLNIHISSTEIRDRIKEGKDISKLVPPRVLEYIKKYNLYKD